MGKGLALCGVTVLFWALYAVYARFAASIWSIDPLVFASIATLAAGGTLLAIGGRRQRGDGTSALRQAHTWIYGLLDVAANTLIVGACFFATATELVLLLRVDVIFGLLLAWWAFARRPRRADLAGTAAILAGCALTVSRMEPHDALWATLLIALGSLARAAATAVAERHPASSVADSVRRRCRTTGSIMLASALVFLVAVGAAALLRDIAGPSAHPVFAALPDGAGFVDPVTVLAAIGLGALIYAPATYFYFYASRLAGTETFLMTLVYQPILTVGLERALSLFTPLPATEIDAGLLGAMLCVLGGSTIMLAARHRRLPAEGPVAAD